MGAQSCLADVGRDGCGACVRGRRGCCAGGVGLCVRRGAHDRTVEVVVHELNIHATYGSVKYGRCHIWSLLGNAERFADWLHSR